MRTSYFACLISENCVGVFLALVKKKIGRFEFNELSREANRERKRLKALRIAEGLPPSSGAEQPAGAEVSGVQA